ncbi:MAG: hypothetical protein EXR79_14140 [Myxococcales bacterium]|nr:hypothetical protein [Myxococcales bacterium]
MANDGEPEEAGARAVPLRATSDAGPEADALDGVQGLRRVAHFETRLVTVHKEVEPPKPKPKGRAQIILKPFVAVARPPGMATMSDLGRAGTSSATPTVARPSRRPVDRGETGSEGGAKK